MNDLYADLAEYIYKETGIVYKESDYYRLEGRVAELVKEFSLENNLALKELLKRSLSPLQKNKIIDIATNNETYFFRDNKPFNTLTDHIIDDIKDTPIYLWSTGCSTGQEVYSILMKLLEVKGKDVCNNIIIEATDISSKALEKAKSGNYDGIEIQRGLPVSLLTKYFEAKGDNSWQFKSEYKKNLSFKLFNLLDENYPVEKFHIIFCRNVLIYQNRENKEKILKNLAKSLKSGGYLILGSGESLIGFDVDLKQVKLGQMIVFKKE